MERLGEAGRPFVTAVAPLLPAVWAEAGDQNLLKMQASGAASNGCLVQNLSFDAQRVNLHI